ncbi:hypothetical protein [Afipia carboxidovorans]|uniref:hypothetical protein n=1 Tax=Afipia carboxidovorans TaxID=40137 RepID=UPI0030D09E9D
MTLEPRRFADAALAVSDAFRLGDRRNVASSRFLVMAWNAKDDAVLKRRLSAKPIGKVVVVMKFAWRQLARTPFMGAGEKALALTGSALECSALDCFAELAVAHSGHPMNLAVAIADKPNARTIGYTLNRSTFKLRCVVTKQAMTMKCSADAAMR